MTVLVLAGSTTVACAAFGAWRSRGGYRFTGVEFTDAEYARPTVPNPPNGVGGITVLRRRFFACLAVFVSYHANEQHMNPRAQRLAPSSVRAATEPFPVEYAAPGAAEGVVIAGVIPEPQTTLNAVTTTAAGWPFLCLYGQVRYRSDPTPRSLVDWVYFVPPGRTPLSSNFPMPHWPLPLRPIWWRLIANTLIFSACWLLVLRSARILSLRMQRFRRMRRGLCPHCRYDLHATPPGLPCPECGTLIKTSSQPPAPSRSPRP